MILRGLLPLQSEALRKRAMIWRNGSRGKNKRRIAVAFRNIAKDLIVRAIFFDDVQHMLEWRVHCLLRGLPVVQLRDRIGIRFQLLFGQVG